MTFCYRRLLLAFIIGVLCLAVGTAALASCGGKSQPSPVLPSTVVKYVRINGHAFRLEVVADEASRAMGLGSRPSLAEDSAMLFIFPGAGRWVFWMKDTLIPLDLLYLDGSGKIVDIQTMQPQPGVPDDQLQRYQPGSPAVYAIEMNAGLAARFGFADGMSAQFFAQAPQ